MKNSAFVCARLFVVAVLAGMALSAAARAEDQAEIKALEDRARLRKGRNAWVTATGAMVFTSS